MLSLVLVVLARFIAHMHIFIGWKQNYNEHTNEGTNERTRERTNERTDGRIDTKYCELFVSYFADTSVFISLQKTTITLTPITSLATVFIQSKRTWLGLGWTNEWGDERTKNNNSLYSICPIEQMSQYHANKLLYFNLWRVPDQI